MITGDILTAALPVLILISTLAGCTHRATVVEPVAAPVSAPCRPSHARLYDDKGNVIFAQDVDCNSISPLIVPKEKP